MLDDVGAELKTIFSQFEDDELQGIGKFYLGMSLMCSMSTAEYETMHKVVSELSDAQLKEWSIATSTFVDVISKLASERTT